MMGKQNLDAVSIEPLQNAGVWCFLSQVTKAKDLLREGASVLETLYQLGFNDIYHLSKCFKKYEGISPSEYKGMTGNGRVCENKLALQPANSSISQSYRIMWYNRFILVNPSPL